MVVQELELGPEGTMEGKCKADSGHEESAPWSPRGASPASPSPSRNAAEMPSSAWSCSSSPREMGRFQEGKHSPSYPPDPTPLPSPWHSVLRADLPGHHPGSSTVSGCLCSSRGLGESTTPRARGSPAGPFGGQRLPILTWMALVGLGAAGDSFKPLPPPLPCARCAQQTLHPPLLSLPAG